MIAHAVVRRPYCLALLPETALAAPGRWFASCSARRDARWLLGQGVIDEFGTFSSPIFLAPEALLGRLYDFGIALAVERDVEMRLDTGWPPVCLGLAVPATLPDVWEDDLRQALTGAEAGTVSGEAGGLTLSRSEARSGAWRIEAWRAAGAAVLATDAPLLPRQLRHLGAAVEGDLVFAYSTGNRLVPGEGPLHVEVAGEATLAELVEEAAEL